MLLHARLAALCAAARPAPLETGTAVSLRRIRSVGRTATAPRGCMAA